MRRDFVHVAVMTFPGLKAEDSSSLGGHVGHLNHPLASGQARDLASLWRCAEVLLEEGRRRTSSSSSGETGRWYG